MDSRLSKSLKNHGLHYFALHGDDHGVRLALREGADINALDEVGRTALMCAVAGNIWPDISAYDASFMSSKRLNILKILVSQSSITLHTLNATNSAIEGVCPLGMAAWLNQPQAVRILLEDSAGSVFVNGMDSHGAIALMYVARDGNLEVVQVLLSHGARPDFTDHNHRSSIQFAQKYPQILWLCESILRHHRWRESKSPDTSRLSDNTKYLFDLMHTSLPTSGYLDPPPSTIFTSEVISSLTNALVSSIRSSKLSDIHSLLFSHAVLASAPPAAYPTTFPALINLPDASGWGLIHHCVAALQPSIDILDTLYCAGADIALYTIHEEETPLHILARSAVLSPSSDSHSLRNFCIHLIRDLRAPLSARDKNDETCLHIAAEKGHSVDLLILLLSYDSNFTVRKMKNSRGLTPFEVAKKQFAFAFGVDKHSTQSNSVQSNYALQPENSFPSTISISALHPCAPDPSNTPYNTPSLYPAINIDVDVAIQELLSNLRAMSLSGYHPAQASHIQSLQSRVEEVNTHHNAIMLHLHRCVKEVSRVVYDLKTTTSHLNSERQNVAVASRKLSMLRGIFPLRPEWRDQHLDVIDGDEEIGISPNYNLKSHGQSHCIGNQTQAFPLHGISSTLNSDSTSHDRRKGPSDKESMGPKTRKLTVPLPSQKVASAVSSRVKAWFKHKTGISQTPAKLKAQIDSGSGPTDPEYIDHSICSTLKTSHVVLNAAQQDLLAISRSIEMAEQFIDLINHSISRVQRAVKSAVRAREAMINDLISVGARKSRASGVQEEFSPSLLGYPYNNTISQQRSLASISTTLSATSSKSSVAVTVAENDDDDIRIIRRLLLRKIEAQTTGAWNEVDRATGWLKIVKEAVESVKRGAYL